jgi:hypothetical protein
MMDLTQARQALYTLEAALANLKPTQPLAQDAVDYAKTNCEQIAEWLRTAKQREDHP